MPTRETERTRDTVCLAAILKDEDQFVEEWLAYHRLLGIDHFYLYDNDPRKPLTDILALHREYVTIRPWLVDHDDDGYPGRTKQLKAYQHCLANGARNYDWITFLDGDEFIVLDEDRDLKAFLADFQGYDSIALNWHVFGHNGHYDNPPGLVIETLTRRMREPRAVTKTISRPEAIATLEVHQCGLKNGSKRVDPNKQVFQDELYPGKTRRAHINHYQCRSFTHWMGKVKRGEVGAFAGDPVNAWRFTQEGCLHQFVTRIAVDKNECVDTSALRFVEPIKAYLHALRNGGGVAGSGPCAPSPAVAANAPCDGGTGRPSESINGLLLARGVSVFGFARKQFSSWQNRLLGRTASLSLQHSKQFAEAKRASEELDWKRAESLWRHLFHQLQDRPPASVYRHLARALQEQGSRVRARGLLRQGQQNYPDDAGLAADLAELAISEGNWSEAASCAQAILNMFESQPHRVRDRHMVAASRGLLGNRAFAETFAALAKFKGRSGEAKPLLALEGVVYLRASRFDEAREHWTEYWRRGEEDAHFAAQRPPSAKPFFAPQDNGYFPPLARVDATSPAPREERVCVYTALFGGYDELRTPAYKPEGWDFICFTDKPFAAPGWDIRLVNPPGGAPAMKNRRLKILPYDDLSEYDCSLYLDSNVAVLGDLSHLYRRWLRGQPFVAWRHPQRGSIFEELEAILASSRTRPDPIIDQYAFFAGEQVPDFVPMIEANFLWRNHRDARVRTLMQLLWEHLTRFQTWRDQPGFSYHMWKTGIRPALLPDRLGTSRDNECVRRFAHKSNAKERERPGPKLPASTSKRLIWVRREKFSAVASTLMRGDQLAEIARRRLDGKVEIGNINERSLDESQNAILILTKGFLKDATLDELARLKKRGHILCADYVDDPERPELHEAIDVYVAASIRQFINYADSYSDKLVHLVSHHADPRLNGIRGPESYCNIGYFGEIVNARYAAELQGRIDFCLVDTKLAEPSWIPRLGHCNVHYAVRNRRPIDGFKPFLKGFTAAHCRANIIIPRVESDAIYYLSSDYPYLLADESLPSVLDMIERTKTSFGGDEWCRGLEIMETVRQRSCPEQIANEIEALISRLS